MHRKYFNLSLILLFVLTFSSTAWCQTTSNLPPKIIKIRPDNNSVFLAGAKVKFQVMALDPNKGDTIEYQFNIGGAIKQAWSSLNIYVWQTSASDAASVDITCEARDHKSAKTSKTITLRIINPTVEEVLQKVADNYARIYDFKADMTLSSTLDGRPFGVTEYCRYYFKAPNKEKTESFSDSQRTAKTEAIIMDGSLMYLVNVVNKIIQKADLLEEAGISGAQFNQMDIFYNQSNFFNTHLVTKNDARTDFNNSIITLDAVPREQSVLYSKLELYIDYSKGVLLKSSLFKDNSLIQTQETLKTVQTSQGAWLPTKMQKTPSLEAGAFITTMDYNNPQVNIGLSDSDFDQNKQY